MTKKQILLEEVANIPDPLVDEVLDFVQFLKTRGVKDGLETALLSESALKKDWLKPEEDEAWKDL